jgi:hypothetical protein
MDPRLKGEDDGVKAEGLATNKKRPGKLALSGPFSFQFLNLISSGRPASPAASRGGW